MLRLGTIVITLVIVVLIVLAYLGWAMAVSDTVNEETWKDHEF